MANAKKTDSARVAPKLGSPVIPENLHNTRGPDYRTIYSNNVAFEISAFDVSFIFGEISGIVGDELHIDQKLRVTMSPQHAKVLSVLLSKNIKTYEAAIGPIQIPGNLTATTPSEDNGGKKN